MSLKIRFRFDGRCSLHPRYNPENDGRPQRSDCPGCESLFVIHLYSHIARRKADCGEGILVSRPETPSKVGDSPGAARENPDSGSAGQAGEPETTDARCNHVAQQETDPNSKTIGTPNEESPSAGSIGIP